MANINPLDLAWAARPQPPEYQPDETRDDMIRPSRVVLDINGNPLNGTGMAMRPGDPGWSKLFAPMVNGKKNSMAPEPLGGEDAPKPVRAAKPKRARNRAEPQTAESLVEVTKAMNGAGPAKKRLVINYARQDGEYMVSVEAAPEWDTMGKPKRVSHKSLVEILPVLSLLDIKVKSNVEEDFE